MKSNVLLRAAIRASALTLVVATSANAGNGFTWQRTADWIPGTAAGGTANNPGPGAGGTTVWQYEWTSGGGLGSSNPWYSQPTNLMSWDPVWYDTGLGVWSAGDNASPPIMSNRLVHNVHESVVSKVPIVRWRAPVGSINDLGIAGSLTVNWNGMNGLGLPVDVDVVVAKQNATQTATTVLFSTMVSKPNPFPSVGDSVIIPINLQNIVLNQGESIIISHRGHHGFHPTGAWVNMYDNLVINTSIPAPGSLAMLGLGALAMGRRRR